MALNATYAPIFTTPSGNVLGWLSGEFFSWVVYVIFSLLFPRIFEILASPFIYRQMLWVVVPLIATLLLMTFYFGAHKNEELGWNTAFGNSMVLIFTSINLLQFIYGNVDHLFLNSDVLLSALLIIEGIFLLFINYFHFLPKKIAFYISSPVHVNLFATFAVIIVYSPKIEFDVVTMFAIVLIYFISILFLNVLQFMIPSTKQKVKKIAGISYKLDSNIEVIN